MLHATFHEKTRLPQQRYADKRSTGIRRTQEDEITSIVFGAIDLLPDRDAYHFWMRLIGEDASDPSGWTVMTELWPKTNGIEPDVRATLKHANEPPRVIVVEVKWNAPLHEHQLLDQWKRAFTAAQRGNGGKHVFIGKTTAFARGAGQWHDGMITLTWREFSVVLGKLQGTDRLARWTKMSIAFLKASGIRDFHGFSKLLEDVHLAGLAFDLKTPIYWRGWEGWNATKVEGMALPPDGSSKTAIFYEEKAK